MNNITFDFLDKEQLVYKQWSISAFVKSTEVWWSIVDNEGVSHDFVYLHEAIEWVDDLYRGDE